MLIALDYDGTYSEDPVLWETFIRHAIQREHEVICVTMRFATEPINLPIPIYYSGRKAKKFFLSQLSIYPDIWIDDQPVFIIEDAYLPPST